MAFNIQINNFANADCKQRTLKVLRVVMYTVRRERKQKSVTYRMVGKLLYA